MIAHSSLPSAVRHRLAPAEQVLWHGQPRQGVMLRGSDALLIPFSLLWGGFAIYWEWSALQTDAPLFFKLWGIPFVLIGLYIIVGRFFFDAYQRARTTYVLTNERALIVRGANQLQSLRLRALADVSLTERADGSGTLALGRAVALWGAWSHWLPAAWPGASGLQPPQFELIADAARVERLIRDAQRRA